MFTLYGFTIAIGWAMAGYHLLWLSNLFFIFVYWNLLEDFRI